MNVFEKLRDKRGYSYVNTTFTVRDFTIFIAFLLMSVGITAVSFFTEIDIIFVLCAAVMLVPFAAFAVCRILSLIITKLKLLRCVKKGTRYRAKIIGERRYKLLFKCSGLFEENFEADCGVAQYSYLPVVEFYKNGNRFELQSKYAVENSFETALINRRVNIYVYKNNFAITDVYESGDALPYSVVETYDCEKINTKKIFDINEQKNKILIVYGVAILVSGLISLAARVILPFVFL